MESKISIAKLKLLIAGLVHQELAFFEDFSLMIKFLPHTFPYFLRFFAINF
jgi:hypothetical protein